MVAFAPVMYMNHINSAFITLCLQTGLDIPILNHFWELIWFKNGYDHFDTFIYKYSPEILTFIPRTTWTFVEGLVGIDVDSHMSNKRMPMMAKNDVGGSSTVNLKLLMDNIRNGTFNDATGTPYPV